MTPQTDIPTVNVKEPQTLEEAKKMIKVLLDRLNPEHQKKQQEVKDQKELSKNKLLFTELQRGARFLEFIDRDLSGLGWNRESRRRLIKQLYNKKFSEEFVDSYRQKIDQIVAYLDNKLKITVAEDVKEGEEVYFEGNKIFKVVKEVDATEFVEEVKKQVESGEIIKEETATEKPNNEV